MMGGNSGGGNSTTTTQVQYSPAEQNARDTVMNSALNTFANSARGTYAGPQVAPQSAQTQAAQGMMTSAAGAQNAQAAQAADASKFGLTTALNPGSNPYLQQAISAAQNNNNQNFQNVINPAIASTATQDGAYGGSRQGVAQGVAAGQLSQANGQIASNMSSDAYTKGLSTYISTLGLQPQIQGMQTAGANSLSQVGAQNENYQQDLLNYLSGQQTYNQTAQWQPLNNLANIIYSGSNGTTTSTNATPSQGGGARGALGGAAGGAAMGSMFGPMGTGVGAVAGGLLGLLG
jgi:hypothetical protein